MNRWNPRKPPWSWRHTHHLYPSRWSFYQKFDRSFVCPRTYGPSQVRSSSSNASELKSDTSTVYFFYKFPRFMESLPFLGYFQAIW